MTNIVVPPNKNLEFYLELEEEIAQQSVEACFFTWSVSPTVIYGKNQIRENEIDEDFCNRHNVRIVQRKSGGGCVYADNGNLMISVIIPNTQAKKVFAAVMQTLADILSQMGYETVKTENNDILVQGMKVSGSACYQHHNATIVHSTMLYDTKFDMLEHALTPPITKLEKHAVKSIRQRVTNLKTLVDFGTMNHFASLIEQKLIQCQINF